MEKKKLLMEKQWLEELRSEFNKPYMQALRLFLEQEEKAGHVIFPQRELIFNAFRHTPFHEVRAVIVGQDPYHGLGQAQGLCFSVPEEFPLPPSLQNIFKELMEDVGIQKPSSGCLIPWASQGVLLLNATLTVRQGEPLSHYGKGWELFTDAVIEKLAKRSDPLVFLLWGKSAQEKCRRILQLDSIHCILQAPHPSPFSAANGFFGCRHFSKANSFLEKVGKKAIDWQLS